VSENEIPPAVHLHNRLISVEWLLYSSLIEKPTIEYRRRVIGRFEGEAKVNADMEDRRVREFLDPQMHLGGSIMIEWDEAAQGRLIPILKRVNVCVDEFRRRTRTSRIPRAAAENEHEGKGEDHTAQRSFN
jgi:hypothetical protein